MLQMRAEMQQISAKIEALLSLVKPFVDRQQQHTPEQAVQPEQQPEQHLEPESEPEPEHEQQPKVTPVETPAAASSSLPPPRPICRPTTTGDGLGNGCNGFVAGATAGCAHPSSDLVQGTSFTARFPFLRRTEATTVPSMSAVEVSVSRRCTR